MPVRYKTKARNTLDMVIARCKGHVLEKQVHWHCAEWNEGHDQHESWLRAWLLAIQFSGTFAISFRRCGARPQRRPTAWCYCNLGTAMHARDAGREFFWLRNCLVVQSTCLVQRHWWEVGVENILHTKGSVPLLDWIALSCTSSGVSHPRLLWERFHPH